MPGPRILVFRGGAIGDFVLFLPVLQELRRRWPDAHVEVAGYPHIACLAVLGALADRVVSLDSADTARLFSLSFDPSPEQRSYFRSFDLLLTYLYDPDGTVKRNLLSVGAAQVIYGSPMIRDGHACDELVRPLEELAIYPQRTPAPRLDLDAQHLERGGRRAGVHGGAVALIHPGSGSPRKNWPLDRFLSMADRMRSELQVSPVFAFGEADTEIQERYAGQSPRFPSVSGFTLTELAEFLSACTACLGNDSGVTHLAAALGVPTVGLYGPTDPGTWGVRGRHAARVVAEERTTEGLAAITVDRVLAAMQPLVAETATPDILAQNGVAGHE